MSIYKGDVPMKSKTIAFSVLISVFALTACGGLTTQSPTSTTKPRSESVSASTINNLPVDKTFDIDITRRGTVYVIDPNVDFSHVIIQTNAGIKNFGDVSRESDMRPRGKLVVGTFADVSDYVFADVDKTTAESGNHLCGVFCRCTGVRDCLDMVFVKQECDTNREFFCSEDGSGCTCLAKDQ
jgi:hypothetical protein